MRELKQIAYAGIILGFIVSIFWLLSGARPAKIATCNDGIKNQQEEQVDCGGPCMACAHTHQITFGEKIIFPHLSIGKTSFYFQLINQSDVLWAENLKYRLDIYNKNDIKIDSIYGALSVPPASITDKGLVPGTARDIIVAADISPIDVARINVIIIENNWREARTYIDARISVIEARVVEGPGRVITRGVIRNNSNIKQEEVIVGIIFRQAGGETIGVSQTIINDISPLATSDFEIFWRNDTGRAIDVNKSEIFVYKR